MDIHQLISLLLVALLHSSVSQTPQPCVPVPGILPSYPSVCSVAIDIFPSSEESVSEQISIFSELIETNAVYSISFIPRDASCISPTFSISHMQLDNDGADEKIVYIYEDGTSTICGESTRDNRCSTVICLDAVPLPGITEISMDTIYTVQVVTGDANNALCSQEGEPFFGTANATLVVNLTLSCAVVPIVPTTTTVTTAVTDCDCTSGDGSSSSSSSSSDSNNNNVVYGANYEHDIEMDKSYGHHDVNHVMAVVIDFNNNTVISMWVMLVVFVMCGAIIFWLCCYKQKKKEELNDSSV